MRRKTFTRAITSRLCALVLLGMSSVPRARADCYSVGPQKGAIKAQSWQGPPVFNPPSFLQVASQEGNDDRIVGFWKIKFVCAVMPVTSAVCQSVD
jgi:hypothetical protein